MVAAACSSDSSSKPADKPLAEKDLRRALVTADDFPDHDFTLQPATKPDKDSQLFPDDSCDDKISVIDADLAAHAGFLSPSGDVTLDHVVELYSGRGGALADAFVTFLSECKLVRLPDGQVTVGPLDFGSLTDTGDSQSAQILIDKGGVLAEVDFVLLYKGDLVSTLVLSGPRPTNKGLLDSLARDALGKLGALEQGV
jgi:hypothetical protein